MIDWSDNRKCFKVNLLEQKTAKSGGVSGGGGVPKYPGKVWLCSHHLHCTLHTASSPQLNINNPVRNSIIFHNYPQCGCLENCSVRTHDYLFMVTLPAIKPFAFRPASNYRNNCERNSSSLGHLCFSVKNLIAFQQNGFNWFVALRRSDCERKIKSFERYFIASIFGC